MNAPMRISLLLRFAVLLSVVTALAFGVLSWLQVERERRFGLEDLDRRARTISFRMAPDALEILKSPRAGDEPDPRLDGHRRMLGAALHRSDGTLAKAAPALGDYLASTSDLLRRASAGERELIALVKVEDALLHLLVLRLTEPDGTPAGFLSLVHDASYLETRVAEGRMRSVLATFALTALLIVTIVGVTWFLYERPLHRLVEWMIRVRVENAAEAPPAALRHLDLAVETDRLAASLRAARSGSAAISREAARSDARWTRERLRSHVTDLLQQEQLGVVSNREPYIHQTKEGKTEVLVPASGLVTALDPVLQACGGFWVAHGAGDADAANADPRGRLTVPPGDSRYTLRRVTLSREEEQGYYYGFSNEGLWPLCHLAHERPVFRATDWKCYVDANRRFADAVLDEIGGGKAFILVQDYHLALVPLMLKAARPDLRVGLFWHIPWPNPEAFRICPWRAEILRGMLGADLIGFHLQQHCNNFLDGVDRMVEARLDWDGFAADLQGHRTIVRPFPISVQSWADRDGEGTEQLDARITALKEQHRLAGLQIAVGVDRIDYTKGLPERFRAVSRLLETTPGLRGRFTLVQLGAPSRTHLPRYREHVAELERLADEINWKFQADGWKPIQFLVAHHDARTVHAFLRMADVCVVSSLHDGMNLVAKEFVAAQEGKAGVLLLSEFAGAAQELSSALIINPYDTKEFAEALKLALEMPEAERRERMERMRKVVEEHNVYRWAADFLTALAELRIPPRDPSPLEPEFRYAPGSYAG